MRLSQKIGISSLLFFLLVYLTAGIGIIENNKDCNEQDTAVIGRRAEQHFFRDNKICSGEPCKKQYGDEY